jgi:hypothetical protein
MRLRRVAVACTRNASCTFKKRDCFVGFNKETLSSLLVRHVFANPTSPERGATSGPQLLDQCKYALLDVAPADAIVRMQDSLFAGQDEDKLRKTLELADTYFDSNYHSGLASCLQYFWEHLEIMGHEANDKSASRPRRLSIASTLDSPHGFVQIHRLVIMTFTVRLHRGPHRRTSAPTCTLTSC